MTETKWRNCISFLKKQKGKSKLLKKLTNGADVIASYQNSK